jgi:hypothetical protein
MIAEPLVYIPKLDPAGIGTCPVSSRRNGTREYDDIIFFGTADLEERLRSVLLPIFNHAG